jgi:hypothetical protein
MRVATRRGPGRAGAHHMVAGATFTTACVKGSLRRPPAALDPLLLHQLTHGNPRSPRKVGIFKVEAAHGNQADDHSTRDL